MLFTCESLKTDRDSYTGAYYLSSAAAQRLLSIPLSKYTDSRVFGNVPRSVSPFLY